MSPTELAAVLGHARERTEALLEPLSDEQLARQVSPLQSPLVWDLAHIGYFEELWLLRRAGGREPLSPGYDDLFDSFAHGRAERGELPILAPEAARAYVSEVREAVLVQLPELDDFLVGMVAQHELQHGETMTQTLALAGLPGPPPHGPPEVEASGEVIVEGGPFTRGSDEAWAYDNERPQHVVDLPRFRVDRALVTNAEYAEFMEAERAPAPLHWDGNADAAPHEPVQHVSFHQAEAYARWAGKRLLTEAEWEKAVKTVGGELEHVDGAVWQWTSSCFQGYPGFRAFPYAEYSEVFFGEEYRVLRGGSWVTDPLVARPTFRNWDLPQRQQIFSGIRCASDVETSTPTRPHLWAATRRSLQSEPRELPPVWLYDERGSQLYEQITRLPDYYLPRREAEILGSHAGEIARQTAARTLVELGSGNARNTRILLDALSAHGTLERFAPVDVSEEMLRATAQAISATYPGILVDETVGDFEHDLSALPKDGPRLIALLGSTLGNLHPEQRAALLLAVGEELADDDVLLLGLDLVKDVARLNAAYHDADGVTEAFVRNALTAVNRELDATFEQRRFVFEPEWDPENEWVDIGFRALEAHTVLVRRLELELAFDRGERLRAEVSSKFRRQRFELELERVGLRVESWWTDAAGDFAVVVARLA